MLSAVLSIGSEQQQMPVYLRTNQDIAETAVNTQEVVMDVGQQVIILVA